MELPKQFDNITQRVIDDLKEMLRHGSKVSMAAASFSIYAFEALQKELEQVDELRFIFTSPTFNKERAKKQKREFYIPKLNRERTLYGSDFEIKLRNNLTQRCHCQGVCRLDSPEGTLQDECLSDADARLPECEGRRRPLHLYALQRVHHNGVRL